MTKSQIFPNWVYFRFGKSIGAEIWRSANESSNIEGFNNLPVQQKLILKDPNYLKPRKLY